MYRYFEAQNENQLNPYHNKTDCHDITEILLKVALNTMNLTLSKILTLYNLRKKIFLEFCLPMEPTLFLFQEYYKLRKQCR
jgi:hypothetical protein